MSAPATPTDTAPSPQPTRKVTVHLNATGDAPILKQSKFKVSAEDRLGKVQDFLRRQLHRDNVFIYCNMAFSPSPDALVQELFLNFGQNGELKLNYACTPAWG
eukprot:jgi/Chlat1/6910/Chrsp52S06636